MATFYQTGGGLIHEDAFENDACPSPESRKTYRGIEDLSPGDVVMSSRGSVTVTVEMIEAARRERVQHGLN